MFRDTAVGGGMSPPKIYQDLIAFSMIADINLYLIFFIFAYLAISLISLFEPLEHYIIIKSFWKEVCQLDMPTPTHSNSAGCIKRFVFVK